MIPVLVLNKVIARAHYIWHNSSTENNEWVGTSAKKNLASESSSAIMAIFFMPHDNRFTLTDSIESFILTNYMELNTNRETTRC
jgi:hypothetical protein